MWQFDWFVTGFNVRLKTVPNVNFLPKPIPKPSTYKVYLLQSNFDRNTFFKSVLYCQEVHASYRLFLSYLFKVFLIALYAHRNKSHQKPNTKPRSTGRWPRFATVGLGVFRRPTAGLCFRKSGDFDELAKWFAEGIPDLLKLQCIQTYTCFFDLVLMRATEPGCKVDQVYR